MSNLDRPTHPLITQPGAGVVRGLDYQAMFKAVPTPLLVVSPPHWIVVAANDARLRATGTTRADQIGRRLFDIFPDDPADPRAHGVRDLTASFQRVLATKSPDTMAVKRYAVRDVQGRFEERWWSPVNVPVLNANAWLRDELLNGEIFYTLREAQAVIESWRRHYNTVRPHASLGYRPPASKVVIWPTEPSGSVPSARPAIATRPTMH